MPPHDSATPPRRILVVDDEELTRRLTGGLVEQMGFEPISAGSGEEAIDKLDDSIDMVLLDVLMPGMSGFELTRRIREDEKYHDLPVILITTLKGREEKLAGVEAGANDFISKPVDKTELTVRMDSLLRMRDMQRRERKHKEQLAQMVSALETAHGELENRVKSRTAELQNTADKLRKEISHRQSVQMELELLEEIFNNSIQGITITDADCNIIKINPAFSAITGYTADEVYGRNPRILKSNKHDEDFYRGMWEKIKTHGRWSGEIWNRRKSGDAYPEWLKIFAFYDEEGTVVNYAAIFHDLTEAKEKDERIEYQASYDALTSLPNRSLFLDRLRTGLSTADRSGARVALLCLNLNNFKHINDTYGYLAGDAILQEIARRLRALTGSGDAVARLDGDMFAMMMTDPKDDQEIVKLTEQIQQLISTPIQFLGHKLDLSTRIGISMAPDDSEHYETLLGQAELAMDRAKKLGENTVQFFTKDMNDRMVRRMELEKKLRTALQEQEFKLFYQPRICIKSMKIIGWEALIRWENEGQIVSPGEFIPLAEETGLIIPIGEWVVRQACEDFRKLNLPDRIVSVNLSPLQFSHKELNETLKRITKETGMAPHSLELEITETNAMTDVHASVSRLKALSDMGFRLAIDDFGTGYSSLAYLKEFPIDVLKIDMSFIQDIEKDANSRMIVSTIIDMAKNFRLEVVAEGVETDEQLEFLKKRGCDQVQGYLLGKPAPFKDILLELP